MRSYVHQLSVGVFIAILLASGAAAMPITGTFTGTARGSLFQGGPDDLAFTGDARGSIFFDTDIPEDAIIERDATALRIFLGPPVEIKFVVTVGDLILDLSEELLGLSRFELFDDGIYQSLRLGETDVCCSNSEFQFVSASHKLFNNFDLTTFNPNDIDLTRSIGSFNARFFGGFTVTPTAFEFGPLGGVSVAEPATLALMLLGLTTLLCCRVRRAREASM